jgi:hypothetical protein
MSNAEQYYRVKAARRMGHTIFQIADELFCNATYIRDLIRVDYVGRNVRSAFLADDLNLGQVRAFSTIENLDAQNILLKRLGPLVHDEQILKAISFGEPVIEIDPDNTIILPSRRVSLPFLPDAA